MKLARLLTWHVDAGFSAGNTGGCTCASSLEWSTYFATGRAQAVDNAVFLLYEFSTVMLSRQSKDYASKNIKLRSFTFALSALLPDPPRYCHSTHPMVA
jgi:hypothetical protein